MTLDLVIHFQQTDYGKRGKIPVLRLIFKNSLRFLRYCLSLALSFAESSGSQKLCGEELVVLASHQQEFKNVHKPERESCPVNFNDYGLGCTLIVCVIVGDLELELPN